MFLQFQPLQLGRFKEIKGISYYNEYYINDPFKNGTNLFGKMGPSLIHRK